MMEMELSVYKKKIIMVVVGRRIRIRVKKGLNLFS